MSPLSVRELIAQLAADKEADARAFALDPAAASRTRQEKRSTASLGEKVATLARDELEAVTPLLAMSVDHELRLAVLRRFVELDADGAAALLIAEAESKRASPGHGLADGLTALTFTLTNFGQYAAGLEALRTALTKDKPRIRALARTLGKYQKEDLDRGIAALGLDADDVKRLRTALKKGNRSAIESLSAVLMPPDPLLPELAVDVLRYVSNKSSSSTRDYGDGLHVLSVIAGVADLSAGVFIDALRHHPGTNESEYAITGLKRLASRLQQKSNRRASNPSRSC